MKDKFVASLDREMTILDQEVALLEREIQHVRRRQDKVRKLKGLYTGVNILPDELEPAEAQIALTSEEMIARVKENAGRELTDEEVREHVHRDFGVMIAAA
jgi:predicted  nucleic acid-binding Zn-ribbon protein